jgi:hypothetical protein
VRQGAPPEGKGMRLKIMVVDGQGGKMGKLIIERLRSGGIPAEILAVGTNSIATAAMMKAGADFGATGENPVVANSRDVDVIVGPLGILAADSLLGEVTPAMAVAIGQSRARKILLPVNRCNHHVVGVQELPMSELVRLAVEQITRGDSAP